MLSSVKSVMGSAALAMCLLGVPTASVAEDAPLRIGVLTDLSGYLSAATGQGTVDAARMAAEDFGGKALGRQIEIVSADHQNKPDVGSAIARKWIDQDDVQVFTGMGNSAVALAVHSLVKEHNRIGLYVSAATTLLTGSECHANGIHWAHDTYMLGNAVPKGLLDAGIDSWYLIVADYAFGRSLADDMRKIIEGRGGTVVGAAFHPQATTDFTSFILSAQTSGAKAIAILNAGSDTVNAIKQVNEFAVTSDGKRLVVGLLLVSDVHALGTEVAQNIEFSTTFYWDMNEQTTQWARRFYERNQTMPTEAHAGAYSAVTHYLKAVEAAGTSDVQAVLSKMHEIPVDDFYSENLKIREDNRLMRNAYIARVKSPENQKEPWDLYDLIATISPEDAFRPIEESDCSMVQKN